MSKVLDLILELKDNFEKDWTAELKAIGIWKDLTPIYLRRGWTSAFSNQVFTFIILAYDNQSSFPSWHKDRWDDKARMASLLDLDIKSKSVRSIIENNDDAIQQVVDWYLAYQKDWRWEQIISDWEYHAEMMRFGRSKTKDKIKVGETIDNMEIADIGISELTKGNISKGAILKAAQERREAGDALHQKLKMEYARLDGALKKEGKIPITSMGESTSWEQHVDARKGYK